MSHSPGGCRWEAVLFDLDDTLYDQREWLSGAFLLAGRCLEERSGLPARKVQEELLALSEQYGSSSGNLFNRMLASHGIPDDPDLIADLVMEFYNYRPQKLTPYPGVLKTLGAICDAGIICGIITNGRPESQRSKIDALGTAGFFSVILVSGDFGDDWKKPSSRMFTKAPDELGVKGSACVYVGDNPKIDFAPARKAGYYTVRIRKGEYASVAADLRADADCTIDEIPQLAEVLGIPDSPDLPGGDGQ